MDFNLTEEQIEIQTNVKKFAQQEVEPLSQQLDQEGRLPDDFIRRCAQLGLLGMTVAEEYGGIGGGNVNCVLAIEQLAYSGTGAWWLVSFHNSIPESIQKFGSEKIKRAFLGSLCDGTAYASIQFTEDDTGSDPSALITTSRTDGYNYVISGRKRFSTFGARDGYAVIYTKDEEGGCTAFVIQKNREGYKPTKVWSLMGGGGIEAADVYLDEYKVSGDNLLGQKGRGFDILLYWIAAEKIGQCAAATGIAQAALDEAINYTKMRTAGGKPISNMQGIRWMLAEMQSKVEAARWLTYRTAFLQDQGTDDWMIEAATAKLFVIPAAMEVVETARRLHGAYGYTRDFKIDRLYRAIAGFPSIAVSLEINRSMVGSSLAK
jgi:butyryl-CoA dehydrogenase